MSIDNQHYIDENRNLKVQITSQIISTKYDQENEPSPQPTNLSHMSTTESIKIKAHCITCRNIYCCVGLFVSLLALFLLMVSCFYAFGQVSTLEVENFFCPEISLNEVREHSVKYGLNKGADESTCYKTKYFRLDENKLFHVNQYDVIYTLSPLNIFKSSLWCFIVVFDFFLLFTYVILLIIDSHKYSYNKSVSILQQNHYGYEHRTEENKSCKCCNCCDNICFSKTTALYFKYYRWYRKYFGEDQLGWLIILVLKEYIEILLQIQALFVYSGHNLFSNKIELGKKPDVVNFFTIILCSNCVFCGLLWFVYAVINKKCSGLFFKHLIFIIDTIFDTFYAVFPLLIEYKENNYNVSVALGAVNFQSVGAFAASFVPMFYLAFKCAVVIYSTRKRMKEKIYEFLNLNFQVTNHIPPSLQMTHIPTHSSTFTSTKFRSATNLTSDTDTDTLLQNKSCCAKQRLFIICISIAFFLTGISLFLWVSADMSNSKQYCLFPDAETIEKHPNLLIYDSECEYKVYPLGIDFPCQCRSAQITFYSDYYINDNNMSFDEAAEYQSEIIKSVLTDWTMLESVTFEGDSNLIHAYFDWNDQQLYKLYQLRIIRFKQNIILSNISSHISNLKQLDVLWVEHGQSITEFPDEMSQLSNLRILVLENIVKIQEIPESFCELTNLRALKLFYHFDSVPTCFSNLKKLETVQIAFLDYVPPEMFQLPNLKEMGLYFSTFTAVDLLASNDTYEDFEYNKNAVYFFTYSTICDDYNNNATEIPTSIRNFIEETDACQVQCDSTVGDGIDKTFFATDLLCFPWLYGDGICHDACNKAICGWDGGDCNQLCGDECNIYESFENGECNNACNTTECDWDGSDCLIIEESACESHGCDISWLNDDWCDTNCNNEDCHFDEGDCDENCKGNICDEVYYIYLLFANAIPDDKVQYNELCAVWHLVYAQAQSWGVGDEWPLMESNCTIVFNFYDKDNDGSVTASDLLNEYANRTGIVKDKLDQIDCSMCVDIDFP